MGPVTIVFDPEWEEKAGRDSETRDSWMEQSTNKGDSKFVGLRCSSERGELESS